MYCIIQELIEFQPKSRKLAQTLKFYQELKKVIYVISDFMSEDANVENCIKKHDITAYASTIFAKKKNARFRYGFYLMQTELSE
jgi:hypothetical protein